jgi:hypothetical protein
MGGWLPYGTPIRGKDEPWKKLRAMWVLLPAILFTYWPKSAELQSVGALRTSAIPVSGVCRRAAFKITNVARFLSDRNFSVMRRRHHHISKHEVSMIKLLAALTAVTGLIALGAGAAIKPKIFAAVEPVAALPTFTISIQELHRQVDMSTLPMMEIKDLY